jgi:hypothetical protein
MFKEYILLILSKSNLIKIIFLIAPGFVLEARHNKTERLPHERVCPEEGATGGNDGSY